MSFIWVFHFKSFCTLTPSSLKSCTLCSSFPSTLTGSGAGQVFFKLIHISLVLVALSSILFLTAQFSKLLSTTCMWLLDPLGTGSYWVQSSAYLQVVTDKSGGEQSSMSLTKTLNSVGEMTPPWGTPAITELVLDRTPGSLTCWVLPVRRPSQTASPLM